ncbi:hypothetical protein [Embleya sp. NPDC001921]
METVWVEIETRPEEPPLDPDIRIVGDLDEIVESTMCSCNAGDDQPY